MSKFLHKDVNILDMHSQWVGDSLIRTVARHFGKKNRIMVDVTEIAPKHTSKERAAKAAKEAARRAGCLSVDCITVSDMEIIRKSQRLESDETVRTKIRTSTFAFDGLPE